MFALFRIVKWYLLIRYNRYRFNTRTKLIAWQNKKVKKLIRFAVKNSRFYQSYYAQHDLNDWQNLPLLDKTRMMENFSTLNTAGIHVEHAYAIAIAAEQSRDFSASIGTLTVGLSSGTSGNRGLFLVSSDERFAWVGAILAKMLSSQIFQKHCIAFFLRANSNIYTTLKTARIQFHFYDLLDSSEVHIKRLNQFPPSILVAPPSMLRLLAINKSQLTFTPIKIISVAEVLDPNDKAMIEQAFGVSIQQVYQATEGFLATTCSYGTLHLNEDILIIQKEYLDNHTRKFVPIITDLYRTTQPIIRYRLNDILTKRASICPCGSIYTALEQIDGRCDDLLYIKDITSATLKPLFPDFIRRALMVSSAAIHDYRVMQTSPLAFEIQLCCDEDLRADIHSKIQLSFMTLFDQLNSFCPTIVFSEFTPLKKGDKLRRIIRRFSL